MSIVSSLGAFPFPESCSRRRGVEEPLKVQVLRSNPRAEPSEKKLEAVARPIPTTRPAAAAVALGTCIQAYVLQVFPHVSGL